MFTATIIKTTRDAISCDVKAGNKWQEAGNAVRAEFVGREAFETVRAAFIDQVIVPALGDEAVRIIAAEVPRKGTTAHKAATESQRTAWAELNDAKKTVRGKASVYFGRILKYAFPKDAAEGEGDDKPAATIQAKALKAATALLAMLQKDEAPSYKHRAACDAAQALIAALTIEALPDAVNAEQGSGKRRA
jgi:hypothetical protein